MKISSAVAMRTSQLLHERKLTQYRFEKNNAIPHNTMKTIMGERNSGVNLKTVMQIARGFDMSVSEFFDDELFILENLDID